MQITTKFDVGQRVTDGTITGKVEEFSYNTEWAVVRYKIAAETTDTGCSTWRSESDLSLTPKPRLTEEEAWRDVILLIGLSRYDFGGFPLLASERASVRQRAYQVLGGAGVEIGRQGSREHEQLREKLNALIKRAEELTEQD